MPHDLAIAEYADGPAVLAQIRDDGDLGRKLEQLIRGALIEAPLMQGGGGDRRAETPDEIDEILRGERLAADHQQHVVEPDRVQCPERCIVDAPEVDVANFGAESGVDRHHLKRHGLAIVLRKSRV